MTILLCLLALYAIGYAVTFLATFIPLAHECPNLIALWFFVSIGCATCWPLIVLSAFFKIRD